jgi:hypothetical protein
MYVHTIYIQRHVYLLRVPKPRSLLRRHWSKTVLNFLHFSRGWQGCQMVYRYFHTKNDNFMDFGRPWDGKVWCISYQFGIVFAI